MRKCPCVYESDIVLSGSHGICFKCLPNESGSFLKKLHLFVDASKNMTSELLIVKLPIKQFSENIFTGKYLCRLLLKSIHLLASIKFLSRE